MRGYIVQRSKKRKNSWTVVLDEGKQIDPKTGKLKRKQVSLSVKGTKKQAEEKLTELQRQIDTGTFVKPSKTTLAEFVERWLRDYARPNLSPRTVEGYETVVYCHLIPGLGRYPLTLLRPEHIQKYYADKLTGGRFDGKGALKPSTVVKHHLVLHCALENAVKWNLLFRNPADAVSPPTPQDSEMHTMSEDDLHKFLDAAKVTPYYALFYTALYTGMRRSELLALRWSDVDLIGMQVSVNRSLHQLRGGSFIFRQPKTAKGKRLIALPPSAALVLKEHKNKQIAQKKALNIKVKEDDLDDKLVFSQDDKPLLPDTVSHAWVKLARRTGLKGIRLHDARHSHASLMLKQGVHPKIVQERLGHASIQITLDTYSHVTPGLQQAAANAFDKGINPEQNNEVLNSPVSNL